MVLLILSKGRKFSNMMREGLKISFSGIAKQFAASGYGVYAMDFPGFGLSEGLHGYIPNFDDLVDDVIEQYTKIKGMIF